MIDSYYPSETHKTQVFAVRFSLSLAQILIKPCAGVQRLFLHTKEAAL